MSLFGVPDISVASKYNYFPLPAVVVVVVVVVVVEPNIARSERNYSLLWSIYLNNKVKILPDDAVVVVVEPLELLVVVVVVVPLELAVVVVEAVTVNSFEIILFTNLQFFS